MGTWGVGAFENDAALDWVDSAAATKSYKPFNEAFGKQAEVYLEGSDGQVIVAAGEALLAAFGQTVEDLPLELAEWLDSAPNPSALLLESSCSALTRVLVPNSELLELWLESPSDHERWRSHLESILTKLNSCNGSTESTSSQGESRRRKKRVKPAEGQVIAIPVDTEHFVVAHVLFVSSYFKNVALYGLLPVQPKSSPAIPDQITYLTLEYGSSVSIRRGDWNVLGVAPMVVSEDCSKRIVGGGLWVGDQHVRQATDQDRREIPKMSVAGDGALIKSFSSFFSSSPRSEFQKKRQSKIETFLGNLISRDD